MYQAPLKPIIPFVLPRTLRVALPKGNQQMNRSNRAATVVLSGAVVLLAAALLLSHFVPILNQSKPGFANGSLGLSSAETIQVIYQEEVEKLLFSVRHNSSPVVSDTDAGLWVRVIDVGQGLSILVQCDGRYMLIDGGRETAYDKVYRTLKENNIDTIDYLIGSHQHYDHLGGLPAAFDYAEVKNVFHNGRSINTKASYPAWKRFHEKIDAEPDVVSTVPHRLTTFTLGSAFVYFLNDPSIPFSKVNNNSLVIKVVYGEVSFLFPTDAEAPEEQELLSSVGNFLDADVFQVGHHGSRTSTTDAWVKAVSPEVSIIPCGYLNEFGHPHAATLDTLAANNSEVYRTDHQGDVTVYSDGLEYWIKTAKAAEDADGETRRKAA
jgi:beta-lactamase superfamily II metal-dependent hydrolase